jgi:hypothetical protein
MQSVHTLFISCPGKVDFDKCSLQQFKSLTIEFNDYFEDVSQFGNLASLKIGFCKSVNNLEGLRGVPYLYLIGCPGITTITPLGNHERLTLKYCENVTSVSFLSNVRSFTINDFEAVNLSSLIDVIFLNFCSLSRKLNEETTSTAFHNLAQIVKIAVDIPISLRSVSCFEFCHSVTLHHGENITDVSPLRTVSRVKLSDFPLIDNINSLGHVPSLTLRHCSSITDISGLGKGGQNNVEVIRCHQIADFSPLSEVNTVTINNCKLFSDRHHISGVSSLSLTQYNGSFDHLYFQRLKKLEISYHHCPVPFPLNIFRNVENITLLCCDFVSIEGIGLNQTVAMNLQTLVLS